MGDRPGRGFYLGDNVYAGAIKLMVEALFDEHALLISSITVKMVQHRGPEGFYAYLVLNVSELTPERYDALRRVVDEQEGSLNIASADRAENEGGNVRIWLRRENS